MVEKTAGISCLPVPHWCSGGMVGGKKQLVYSCLSWPHWYGRRQETTGIQLFIMATLVWSEVRNSWYTVVYHGHIGVVVVKLDLVKHGC